MNGLFSIFFKNGVLMILWLLSFQISLFIMEWSVASDHARYSTSFVKVIGCGKLKYCWVE